MVSRITMCAVGVVIAAVMGCGRSDPRATGAQIAPAATGGTVASSGEFRYAVIDGVPVIGWYAPDGKQVILMRVDSRWVCDQSSGQLRCGPRQAGAAPCPGCQLFSCPCADARCLPLCNGNATVLPGLHDPAAAAP
jgi:hypothetical protein